MVAGLSDGTVHILSPNGETLRILPKPDDNSPATSLAIEAHHLFIGRTSGCIESWNLQNGYLSLSLSTPVYSIANPSSLHSTQEQSTQAHKSTITSLIAHDPETLISSSRDHTLKLSNPSTLDCKHHLRDHTDVISTIATSSALLASASHDTTCKLYSLPSGTLLHALRTNPPIQIRSLALTESLVIAGGSDGSLHCWDVSDGSYRSSIQQAHTSLISHIRVSLSIEETKGMIVTGGADGMLKAWSLNPNHPPHLEELWAVKAHPNAINSLEVKKDLILTGGSEDVIKIWDLENGALVREIGVKSSAVWKVGFVGQEGTGKVVHGYWDEGVVVDIWDLSG